MAMMEDVEEAGFGMLVMVAVAGTLVVVAVKGIWRRLHWHRGKDERQVDQKEEREEMKDREKVEKIVRLYLAPEAEEAAMPTLTNHTAVPMRGHNILPAYVNGRYCEIFVDCGTSSALMKYRLAKHLGLLSQVKRSKVIMVRMWARMTIAKMLVVEAVTVELAGGVSFPCTFLVAPKEGPINYLKNDIFLDNATLRRTRAFQCFSPSSATLFFPSPMPEWRPRTSPDSQLELDNARFGKCVKNDRLKVHMDTGARYFYASRKHHRSERSVEVVVARDSVIRWRSLTAAPTTTFDFVLGTHPLAKYYCLLDFANQYLYFCIDDRVYRARLRRTNTL